MGRNLPSGTVTFLFTDVAGSTRLLHDLGTERYAGALAEHRRLLRQAFAALARARALGNDRIVGTTLGALGEYDIREGNVDAALPKLLEAYEISRDLFHPLEIAVGLCRLAWALALRARPEPAAQVLARSLGTYEELGVDVPAWVKPMNDEVIAIIGRSLDDAAKATESDKGRDLTVDEAVGLARDLLVTPG